MKNKQDLCCGLRSGFMTIAMLACCGIALAQQTGTGTTPATSADVPAASQSTTSTGAVMQTGEQSKTDLLIGGGDLLDVSIYGVPDFNKQVRVNDAGEVSLPLLGAVKLSGMTARQGERTLEKLLVERGLFADPQVSIFVKEYATQAVSVLGEVQKPGIYPLLGKRSLFDALSAAGGTTAKAGDKVTITHRDRPTAPEIVELSYKQDELGTTSNVPVLPGDTVVVSKAGIVYVVGDVRMPSGLVMQDSHLTVLQAIAMAQGTNPTAALDSGKLIRKGAKGQEEIPVQLQKILSSKAPDLQLQADDILFIPTSAAKSAGRRSMDAILQTLTGIAIYRR